MENFDSYHPYSWKSIPSIVIFSVKYGKLLTIFPPITTY